MNNSTFRQNLLDFPKQFRVGLDATRGLKIKKPRNTSHLVICGMGGSAFPGLLLRGLYRSNPRLRKKHLHIIVHRDYGLPPEATNSKAVVVVISYSGNTEETLNAYRKAIKLKLPTFVITTGGRLARLARRNNIPSIIIPAGVEPRFAVGYQFGALLGLAIKLGFVPSVLKKELIGLEKALSPQKSLVFSKSLAGLLKGKRRTPLIYGSSSLSAAIYSWKTNIHENAKLPASFHLFPELNHNELNIFSLLTKTHKDALKHFFVIMVRDEKDNTRIKKRFSLTANIIKSVGVPVRRVEIAGKNASVRLFSAYLLGLAFSGVLAERLGIDPLPTPVMERFKKKLK